MQQTKSHSTHGSDQNIGTLFPQDEAIEMERQEHLRTIDLLDRVANGDTSVSGLLPTELLEDPLDAHLLYVRWTLDTFGSQEENLKKFLITLLEQSTRRFVNQLRYHADLRYLKLWVLYARQCSKPGALKIYEYLYSKKIGVEFSMFYEEWASSIDQHPDHIKAIEGIFDLGIKREAQPLNRLKKRKIAILQRVSQSTPEKKPSQPSLPSSNELCDNPLQNHFPLTNPTQNSNRDPSAKKTLTPPVQRLALDLSKLYPDNNTELSPEECKASRQFGSRRWGVEPWELEAFTTGNWYYYNLDGSPILYDPVSREALFEYLKPQSPTSSAMQLSDDEAVVPDFLDNKSETSYIMSQDADISMATSEHIANLSLSDLTSSTDNDDQEVGSVQDAIADTEISIKLDSPARHSSTAHMKARNRRASVTINTQEALNAVNDLYGQPGRGSEESDDNSDMSEPADDRLLDEMTVLTVAGIRDATADVTFWSHVENKSNLNEENPSTIQDENAIAYRQPIAGPSEPSSSGPSRGLGAFKPVRKPLAPVVPFGCENDVPMASSSGAQPMYPVPGASAPKRMPLAVKATHPQQAPIHQEIHHDPEPDRRVARTHMNVWQAQSPSDELENQFHTPEMNDEPQFSSQEEYQSDVNINYEGVYVDNQGYEDENQIYEDENHIDRGGRLISRPLRFVPVGDNFNALTPITERTSEFNSRTAPRYINRNPEARFLLHQQRPGNFSGMDFDDDEQAESTPKANHFNEEDSEEKNSFEHNPGLHAAQEYQESERIHSDASELSPVVNPHRMHHSLETPSKLRARLHPSSDAGTLHSPVKYDVEDSNMASPSRFYSDHHVPGSPTTIQACEPCNPFATDIVNILLEGLDPPLEVYPGFQSFGDQTANKLQQLRRRCKTRNRKHSHSNASAEEALWEVDLGGEQYIIYEKLGEGAFGSVFRVSEAVDEDCTAMYEDNSIQKAMKVESPPNLYEFSILSQLHQTLAPRLCESIIKPHKLYAYSDESFLMMDYLDQGTLLDLVNHAADIGIKPTAPGITRGVEEIVAMFFTIELMRVVEGLHEAGYIHGDLKIDNCMVRLQGLPGGSKSWSSTYHPGGQEGWSYKGLKLIDYGRAIDTGVFPPSQQFIAEWETDEFDCKEMRTGKPWTFQPDYHGIIAIAHCLLFGAFMSHKDALKPPFKRYHQTDLWSSLFDVCLNPAEIPNSLDLRAVRLAMEHWLQLNCERNGKSLKGFLKKIEVASLSGYH